MGKDEKKLTEMARMQNRLPPARIQNAPDLLPGLEIYYDAFNRLTSSRALAKGLVGAIPYSAISGYCKDEGIEGETREDMIYHVERLDLAYISWQIDRSATLAKQQQETPPNGPRSVRR